MNKKLKQDKAITLIALVVTVIIIVILGGVSLSLVLGQNGIVNKAKEAATMHSNAAAQEKMELLMAELEISKDYKNGASLKDSLDQLKEKNSSITDVKEIDDNKVEVTVDDKYKFLITTDENGKIDVESQGEISGGGTSGGESAGTTSSATASGLTKTYTGSEQTGVAGTNVDWSGTTSATNAGTYTAYATPKANYAWSDGTRTTKTITWEIKKAQGELILRETSASFSYDMGVAMAITKNTSGGTISATSSDTSIATVSSVSGSSISISGSKDITKVGTVTITVTSAATDNYEAATATITVTVQGRITATATGYSGSYGGYGSIKVTSDVSDATITYATSSSGPYSTTNPSYFDVGTYTVYYKVEKEGYISASGSAKVTITKLSYTPTFSGYSSGSTISTGSGGITLTINKPVYISMDYISLDYDEDNLNVTITGNQINIYPRNRGTSSTLYIYLDGSDNWDSSYARYTISASF